MALNVITATRQLKRQVKSTKNSNVATPIVDDPTLQTWIKSISNQIGTMSKGLLTKRDLIDFGLVGYENGNLVNLIPKEEEVNLTVPAEVVNLVAGGAYSIVTLTWETPKSSLFGKNDIYRSEINDFGTAVNIGSSIGDIYSDYIGNNAKVYYWVRTVSKFGVEGKISKSVYAETSLDINYLLENLKEKIDESLLAKSFQDMLKGYENNFSNIDETQKLFDERLEEAQRSVSESLGQMNQIIALTQGNLDLATGRLQEEIDGAKQTILDNKAILDKNNESLELAISNAKKDLTINIDQVKKDADSLIDQAKILLSQSITDAETRTNTVIENKIKEVRGENAALAESTNKLAVQMRGGYDGDDLDQVSTGLLYQQKQVMTTQFETLAKQISMVSASGNNEFDSGVIYFFDDGAENWIDSKNKVADVNSEGWIKLGHNANSWMITSSAFNTDLNASKYNEIRLRIRKIGDPLNDLVVSVQDNAGVVQARVVDKGDYQFDTQNSVVLSIKTSWTIKTISKISISRGSASSYDALNYFEVDWVAIGRPSPSASYSTVTEETIARVKGDEVSNAKIEALRSEYKDDIKSTNSRIDEESSTRVNQNEANAKRFTNIETEAGTLNKTVSGHTGLIETNSNATEANTKELKNLRSQFGNTALSEVLKTYSTTANTNESITNAINNYSSSLTIGGTNLIDNSSFENDMEGWSYNYLTSANVTVVEDLTIPNGVKKCIKIDTTSAGQGIFRTASNMTDTNVDAIVSVWAKGAKGGEILRLMSPSFSKVEYISLTNKWARYSVSAKKVAESALVTFYTNSAGANTMYLSHAQLERGNKVTDWSPSQNDNKNEITKINANISENYYTKSKADEAITNKLTTYDAGIQKSLKDVNANIKDNYYTKADADKAASGQITAFNASLVIGGSNIATNDYSEWESVSVPITTYYMEYATGVELKRDGTNYTISLDIEISPGQTGSLTLQICATKDLPTNSAVVEWTSVGVPVVSGKRSVITFNPTILPSFSNINPAFLRFRIRNERVANSYRFRNLQVEEGNKPTAWSPSYIKINKQIDVNAEAIKSTQTEVKDLGDGYVATNKDILDLKGRTEKTEKGLLTKVESETLKQYYTTTEANNAIAGQISSFNTKLVIGGTNLITQSRKNFRVGGAGAIDTGHVRVVEDGSIKVTGGLLNTWYGWYNSTTDFSRVASLGKGSQFTVSIYVRAVDLKNLPELTFQFYVTAGYGYKAMTKVAGDFSKGGTVQYAVTFDVTDSLLSLGCHMHVGGTIGGGFYLDAWKIESGNKATDWSANADDPNAVTKAINANISENIYTKTKTDEAIANKLITYDAGIQEDIRKISSNITENYLTKVAANEAISNKLIEFNTQLVIGATNLLTGGSVEKYSKSITNNEYLMYLMNEEINDIYSKGQITISFDIKVDVAGNVQVYNTNQNPDWTFSASIANVTTTYQRRSVTVTPTKRSSATGLSGLEFYGIYGTGRFISVKNVKIELGNKATDWSPSAKDTQNALNTEITKINANLKDNYYTSAKADEAIAAQIKNFKSDLTIGAKNLIPYSSFEFPLTSEYGWNSNGGTHTIIDDLTIPNGAKKCWKMVATAGSHGLWRSITSVLEANVEVTISIWAKGAVGGEKLWLLSQSHSARSEVTLTTEWKRYSFTAKKTAAGTFSITMYSSTAGTFYLSQMQYERGSFATDWSPYVGDIQGQITKSQSWIDAFDKTYSNDQKSTAQSFKDLNASFATTIGASNLLRNSMFTLPLTVSPEWSPNGAATIAVSDSVWMNGCKGLVATFPATIGLAWHGIGYLTTADDNAYNNKKLQVRFGSSSTVSRTFAVGVHYMNSAGSVISEAWVNANHVTGSTNVIKVEFPALASTTRIRLMITEYTNTANRPPFTIVQPMLITGDFAPANWTPSPLDADLQGTQTAARITEVSNAASEKDKAYTEKFTQMKSEIAAKSLPTEYDTTQANTWLRIWYNKEPADLAMSVVPTYENLMAGPYLGSSYVADGSTMTADVVNCMAIYRAFAYVSVSKTINLGKITGDDAHAIYVNQVKSYSLASYGISTSDVTLTLRTGWNCIDVLVNQGTGNIGFTTPNKISTLVEKLYPAVSPTLTRSDLANLYYTKSDANQAISGQIKEFSALANTGGSNLLDNKGSQIIGEKVAGVAKYPFATYALAPGISIKRNKIYTLVYEAEYDSKGATDCSFCPYFGGNLSFPQRVGSFSRAVYVQRVNQSYFADGTTPLLSFYIVGNDTTKVAASAKVYWAALYEGDILPPLTWQGNNNQTAEAMATYKEAIEAVVKESGSSTKKIEQLSSTMGATVNYIAYSGGLNATTGGAGWIDKVGESGHKFSVGRSYGLVTFNAQGEIATAKAYDIYGGATAITAFNTDVANLPAGTYVLVITGDEPSGNKAQITDALISLGGSKQAINTISARYAYLLLGCKGFAEGAGLEQVSKDTTIGVKQTIQFINGVPTGLGSSSGSLSAKITEITEVVNGQQAMKAVWIDNNGIVSGWGTTSEIKDGKVNSTFGVYANTFYVADPSNPKAVTYPLIVDSGKVVINTVAIKDGSIENVKLGNVSADKITTGEMSGDRIKANTINTKHLTSDVIEALSILTREFTVENTKGIYYTNGAYHKVTDKASGVVRMEWGLMND